MAVSAWVLPTQPESFPSTSKLPLLWAERTSQIRPSEEAPQEITGPAPRGPSPPGKQKYRLCPVMRTQGTNPTAAPAQQVGSRSGAVRWGGGSDALGGPGCRERSLLPAEAPQMTWDSFWLGQGDKG